MKQPSALVPLVMSFAALALVLGHAAVAIHCSLAHYPPQKAMAKRPAAASDAAVLT